jgi:hypothetical protein
MAREVWRARTPTTPTQVRFVVSGEEPLVVAATDRGLLVAWGLEDGQLRWAHQMRASASSLADLGDGHIVASAPGEELVVVRTDGRRTWSLRSPLLVGVAVVAGRIVAVDRDGLLRRVGPTVEPSVPEDLEWEDLDRPQRLRRVEDVGSELEVGEVISDLTYRELGAMARSGRLDHDFEMCSFAFDFWRSRECVGQRGDDSDRARAVALAELLTALSVGDHPRARVLDVLREIAGLGLEVWAPLEDWGGLQGAIAWSRAVSRGALDDALCTLHDLPEPVARRLLQLGTPHGAVGAAVCDAVWDESPVAPQVWPGSRTAPGAELPLLKALNAVSRLTRGAVPGDRLSDLLVEIRRVPWTLRGPLASMVRALGDAAPAGEPLRTLPLDHQVRWFRELLGRPTPTVDTGGAPGVWVRAVARWTEAAWTTITAAARERLADGLDTTRCHVALDPRWVPGAGPPLVVLTPEGTIPLDDVTLEVELVGVGAGGGRIVATRQLSALREGDPQIHFALEGVDWNGSAGPLVVDLMVRVGGDLHDRTTWKLSFVRGRSRHDTLYLDLTRVVLGLRGRQVVPRRVGPGPLMLSADGDVRRIARAIDPLTRRHDLDAACMTAGLDRALERLSGVAEPTLVYPAERTAQELLSAPPMALSAQMGGAWLVSTATAAGVARRYPTVEVSCLQITQTADERAAVVDVLVDRGVEREDASEWLDEVGGDLRALVDRVTGHEQPTRWIRAGLMALRADELVALVLVAFAETELLPGEIRPGLIVARAGPRRRRRRAAPAGRGGRPRVGALARRGGPRAGGARLARGRPVRRGVRSDSVHEDGPSGPPPRGAEPCAPVWSGARAGVARRPPAGGRVGGGRPGGRAVAAARRPRHGGRHAARPPRGERPGAAVPPQAPRCGACHPCRGAAVGRHARRDGGRGPGDEPAVRRPPGGARGRAQRHAELVGGSRGGGARAPRGQRGAGVGR